MTDDLSAPATCKAHSALRDVMTSSGALAGLIEDTLPEPMDALENLFRNSQGVSEGRFIASLKTAVKVLRQNLGVFTEDVMALRELCAACHSEIDAWHEAAQDRAARVLRKAGRLA